MKKYIGLKVKYFNFWVWFEAEKINKGKEVEGKYVGCDGWGLNGNNILKLEVDIEDVTGQIIADSPMYTI